MLNSKMKEELLKMLKSDAYRKGEYTLSSGKTSEHYVNCKPVILNGKGLFYASCLLLQLVDDDSVSVGGLTLGADPLVSGVAVCSALDQRLVDALIVRKEPKGHGTQSQVEGPLPPMGTFITRMIASGTNALANSVVLVCRKREVRYGTITRAEFIRQLKNEQDKKGKLPDFL